jgi:hypothetical protein
MNDERPEKNTDSTNAGDPLRVQKDIAIFALPCAINVVKKTWKHKVRAYTKPLFIAVNDALKNAGSELALRLSGRKAEPKLPEFLDRAHSAYDKEETQSITPDGEFTLHVQLSLNQAEKMCLSWGIDYWQPLSAGEDTSVGEAFMNDLAQQTRAAVPYHPGRRRTWYFIHSREYAAEALAALDKSIVEIIRDDMIKLDKLVRLGMTGV